MKTRHKVVPGTTRYQYPEPLTGKLDGGTRGASSLEGPSVPPESPVPEPPSHKQLPDQPATTTNEPDDDIPF